MEALFAIGIGVVVTAAVYLFLSRSLPRLLIGFVMLGTAVNMLILVSGRTGTMAPPLVGPDAERLAPHAANALPQALILTAIVIGLGLAAFALALILRFTGVFGTVDATDVNSAETIDTPDLTQIPDVSLKKEAA